VDSVEFERGERVRERSSDSADRVAFDEPDSRVQKERRVSKDEGKEKEKSERVARRDRDSEPVKPEVATKKVQTTQSAQTAQVQTEPRSLTDEERESLKAKALELLRDATLKEKLLLSEQLCAPELKAAVLDERETQLLNALLEKDRRVAALREDVDALKEQLTEKTCLFLHFCISAYTLLLLAASKHVSLHKLIQANM